MWASERSLLWAQAENGIVGLWRCFVKGSFLVPVFHRSHLPSHPSPTHSITEQTALCKNTMVHQSSFPSTGEKTSPQPSLQCGHKCFSSTSCATIKVFYKISSVNVFTLKKVVRARGHHLSFICVVAIFKTLRAINLPPTVL